MYCKECQQEGLFPKANHYVCAECGKEAVGRTRDMICYACSELKHLCRRCGRPIVEESSSNT
jgi:hypothetical protein